MRDMKIIDFHCDVLSKLLVDSELHFDEKNAMQKLDVTLERLIEADYLLQVFAIYIPSDFPKDIYPILKSISLFYDKILQHPQMLLIQSKADIKRCRQEGKVGAMLSLEGVTGLEGHIYLNSILQSLGVRSVGLTWNDMNWAADGVLEARGAGLTGLGVEFVNSCQAKGIIVDVSHLSERSFWDVFQLSYRPFIASHSNAKTVCNHPRNLSDEQIAAIIQSNGLIGLTYVPWFVAQQGASMKGLLSHVEHMLSLGGENHLMLGSDFDGIDQYIPGLQQPKDVLKLQKLLEETYDSTIVEKIMWKNAYHFLINHL